MIYCFCSSRQAKVAENISKKQGMTIDHFYNIKDHNLSDILNMLKQHDTVIICKINDIASSFSSSISFISFVLDNNITLICAAPDLVITEHEKDKEIKIGINVAVKLKKYFERKIPTAKKVGRPQGNSICDAHKSIIIEMLGQGIPFTVIARKINVKYTTLKAYCNRHDLIKSQ